MHLGTQSTPYLGSIIAIVEPSRRPGAPNQVQVKTPIPTDAQPRLIVVADANLPKVKSWFSVPDISKSIIG
jgi:hypothetical protein